MSNILLGEKFIESIFYPICLKNKEIDKFCILKV